MTMRFIFTILFVLVLATSCKTRTISERAPEHRKIPDRWLAMALDRRTPPRIVVNEFQSITDLPFNTLEDTSPSQQTWARLSLREVDLDNQGKPELVGTIGTFQNVFFIVIQRDDSGARLVGYEDISYSRHWGVDDIHVISMKGAGTLLSLTWLNDHGTGIHASRTRYYVLRNQALRQVLELPHAQTYSGWNSPIMHELLLETRFDTDLGHIIAIPHYRFSLRCPSAPDGYIEIREDECQVVYSWSSKAQKFVCTTEHRAMDDIFKSDAGWVSPEQFIAAFPALVYSWSMYGDKVQRQAIAVLRAEIDKEPSRVEPTCR